MRPTQKLYSGPNWKVGQWLGHDFGAFGGAKQKGIITYGLAANRQNPVAGYYIMHWATERNEYLNSKAGRAEFEGAEE